MQLLFAMPGNEALSDELVKIGACEAGTLDARRFPDGESYVRIRSGVAGRRTAILCTLARPDERVLALLFAAREMKSLGALSVTLIAPYLPYMRQDIRFNPGEALTSRHFAELISREFDALVTVDPHLHRYAALEQVYDIPALALAAAPLLAAWVRANVTMPVIVGPDAESEQWVSEIAAAADAPFVLLEKRRLGDRQVQLSVPPLGEWRQCHPVIVDDVISSGATALAALHCLAAAGLRTPACLAVHALFSNNAEAQIVAATTALISTNSVPHATNGVTIAPLIASALSRLHG